MSGNQQLSLALPLAIQAMAVEQEALLLVILRKVRNFIPLAVCPDWYMSLGYTGSPSGPSVGDNDEDIEMSSADMTDIIRHLEQAENEVEKNLVELKEAKQTEDATLAQLKSGIKEYRGAVTRHLLVVHWAV